VVTHEEKLRVGNGVTADQKRLHRGVGVTGDQNVKFPRGTEDE